MKGDNHLLAITTTTDDVTNEVKPLFAFPVQVCSATSSTTDVKFAVAAPSGVKREQQWLDPATGAIVPDEECPRGVYVGDEFRPIPGEAIADVSAKTKIATMVALGVLPLDEALHVYAGRFIGRYYLQVPAKGGSAKAYKLVYEGLLPEKGPRGKVITPAQAIVTKRTARSRQKLALIYADEREQCLVMVEVAFAANVKEPDDQVRAFAAATVEAAQVGVVRKVLSGIGDGHLALENEADEAIGMKRALVEAAVAGVTYTAPVPIKDTVESNALEDALEASLAAIAA